MSHKQLTRIATTMLTLVVVLSTMAAPVAAAAGDDGGLASDDDDGGGVITNTTDTLTDTVDSAGDTLSDTTGVDGVDSTTDSVTDTVDSTGESVASTAGTDSLNGVSSPDQLAFDEVPAVDSLVGPDAGVGGVSGVTDSVGTGDVGAPNQLPDGLADLPIGAVPTDPGAGGLPDASAPTNAMEQTVSTDQLPVAVSDLPLESVPLTGDQAPVQPEDSPYGSDGHGNFNACNLPVTADDLPLDSVPAPDELGAPNTGLPTSLLTPSAVGALALNAPPRPCTVYDLHDPSIDPTEIPDDPSATLGSSGISLATDQASLGGYDRGQIYEVTQYSSWLVGATDESIGTYGKFRVSDGTTNRYLYLYNFRTIDYRNASSDGRTRAEVLGQGVGVTLACSQTDLANASFDYEEPTKNGPCSYELGGVPSLPVGPATVLDKVENPPELPGIGGLPANSDSLANL